MADKLTSNKQLWSIKPYRSSVTCSCDFMWHIEHMVTYCDGFMPVKSFIHLNQCYCEVTGQIHYISTCKQPVSTELGKVVTYHDWFSALKSNNSWITWPLSFHLITRAKFYTLATKLGRAVTCGRGSTGKLHSCHWLIASFFFGLVICVTKILSFILQRSLPPEWFFFVINSGN